MTPEDAAGQSQADPEQGLAFPQDNPECEKYTKYNIFHKEENEISR
jgi:hypothetical protein